MYVDKDVKWNEKRQKLSFRKGNAFAVMR